MQSTIFKNMYSQNCRDAEWQEIINIIRGNSLKADTDKYRYYLSCNLNNDAQDIKRHMPAFTPAVVCNGGRKPENFVCLTGVGMCDFDHVDDIGKAMAAAADDIHTMMAYRTISGKGVRVLFRYEPKDGAKWPDNGDAKGMAAPLPWVTRIMRVCWGVQPTDSVRTLGGCR